MRVMRYDVTEFAQSCVDAYVDLAGGNLAVIKKVSSPYLTEADEDPKGERSKGRLGPIAARVMMKILCAARVVRFDLLKGIQQLATRIATWTSWCDKALHRLV